MDYMETDEFKNMYSERYKIEAKNAELKSNFDYEESNATEKVGLQSKEQVCFFGKYEKNN